MLIFIFLNQLNNRFLN